MAKLSSHPNLKPLSWAKAFVLTVMPFTKSFALVFFTLLTMGFFSQLLGLQTAVDWKAVYAKHPQIIDVRSSSEYAAGHLANSTNIPVDNLSSSLTKIDKARPVITVCASGMRSEAARRTLKAKGYEVYNGGSWTSLKSKLGL